MNRRLLRALAVALLVAIILLAVGRVGVEAYAAYHVSAADDALAVQNYVVARDHLETALRVRRDSLPLELRLARVCRQAGDFAGAERHLDKYRALHGELSDDYQLERLMFKAEVGRLDEVFFGLFPYVQDDQPATPLVLECLCQTALRLDLSALANAYADHWLRLQPDNVQALYCKGVGLWHVSSYEGAARSLQRALDRDPSRDDIRRALVSVYVESQRFAEALPLCDRLLARDPNDFGVRLNLARCRREMGETEQAREILDALLADNDKEPDLLLERARLAISEGKPAEAEPLLRKALERAPSYLTAAHELLVCLTQLDKTGEAAKLTDRIHEIEADLKRIEHIVKYDLPAPGTGAAAYQELGAALMRTGREEPAVHWLYKGLEIDPKHAPSHKLLADYWDRVGEPKKAEPHRAALKRLQAESEP